MTRDQAIEIARRAAKLHTPSYYAEPFQPHEWVIDAIIAASIRQPPTEHDIAVAEVERVKRVHAGHVEYGSDEHQEMYTPLALRLMGERDAAVAERDSAKRQCEAMRSVVEAAGRWRDAMLNGAGPHDPAVKQTDAECVRVVDAFRASRSSK